jgi:NhaA family Na+:H+ antiporter
LPVNFIVIPLFALANTAIRLPGNLLQGLGSPAGIGILSGLLLGKTLGITGAVFLLVRLGVSDLPGKCTWAQMGATGLLAGCGFTMSIFITLLAYNDVSTQDNAKIAVLTASLLAIAGSAAWFWLMGKKRPIQTLRI